ncbi:radical SAM family heme chaperone HemW [Akkermansiaceae bacterium]|nr:radical SAM family heme chaperone HemW [Akkermansiaceae bacterium]
MHLYLHVPFCHRICPYCSFYKHTPGGTDIGAFVEALLTEAEFAQKKDLSALKTIYLGGGTPSMLSPKHLTRLFTGLRQHFDFNTLDEVTLEANPATFTAKTAGLYADLGVTRVSLGIQSFHPDHLKTLGREHTSEQARSSVAAIQEPGSLEVNIDLIFSVPGQTHSDWESTLKEALAAKPDHISAYNLTYEEDTAFFDQFEKGNYQDDPDLNAKMFSLAQDLLTSAGYEHYETSNYALPGKRSQHNAGYWTGNDYLGLGPSAVSTINRLRWQNVCDTASYLKRIDAVGHAQDSTEELDNEAWRLERLALQLRTIEGLPKKFVLPESDLTHLKEQNLIEETKTHLRLTGDGPLLVDSIAAELA